VPDDILFPADFDLAQRCLEGGAGAIREFQETYRPVLMAYLRSAGATLGEAEEVTEWLWADCLHERAGQRPRLANYAGQAALKSWLYPVALNHLIGRKRQQNYWSEILQEGLDAERLEAVVGPEGSAEAPLMALMREAVEAGFQACAPEEFVILQLARMDGLQLGELATMFNCSKSKIDRDLEQAEKTVAEATLSYIRQADPWLELKWKDFVELCRVASPACFGLD
jgi:RNA polymerase sigma factor (sigma-70 family)